MDKTTGNKGLEVVTQYGNWSEVVRKVMNLGRQIEREMLKTQKPFERINFLIERFGTLGEYLNALWALCPEDQQKFIVMPAPVNPAPAEEEEPDENIPESNGDGERS
jgi:hypothetical protein